MKAEELVELYSVLIERGVRVWVDGGWGIDALLNQHTRHHKDFDALVAFDDLSTMTDVLAERGFTLKEIWDENRWVIHPFHVQLIGRESPAGNEVATAFVLRNENGHEIDVHVLRFDGDGNGIPAWNSNLRYPANAWEGRGSIADTSVRCLSAHMHMATHTGYELQSKDLQDLRLLHEHFGIAYMPEHDRIFSEVIDRHDAPATPEQDQV